MSKRDRRKRRREAQEYLTPTPQVPGLYSQQVERCSTCCWWETPRRKRTCRRDRTVKLADGSKVKGTPPDYVCKDYSPQDVATCGDCEFWTENHRPRKRKPCSELGLTDATGKSRTSSSPACGRYYEQTIGYTARDNPNLRINGILATILDLDQHSTPQAFIIRADDDSGIALVWIPEGPGTGRWEILPVETKEDEDGYFSLRQHIDVSSTATFSEIAFAGRAELVLGAESMTLGGQSFRTSAWTNGRKSASDKKGAGLSKVVLRSQAVRKRAADNIDLSGVEEEEEITSRPRATRVQDEPWGSDWNDIKEQLQNLIDAGFGVRPAAVAVQRNYFRENAKLRLSRSDGKRLQRQLIAVFKDA